MPSTSQTDAPFWERIPLEAMTPAQWESLCDGCAKCCLQKYQDEDTGRSRRIVRRRPIAPPWGTSH